MLQPSHSQLPVQRELETISPEQTLASFVGFIRRQMGVVIFVVLLAFSLGLVYVTTTPPSYTAYVKLLIDARKVQLFQQQSILGEIPIDTASVESQVELLKSDNVAASVIKALHLTDDPEFTKPKGGLFGTIISFILHPFGQDGSDISESEFELQRRALDVFKDRVSANRVGLTYVIQIGFRSFNRARSAQIANAIADAYIVDQLDAKYKATQRASAWLQDRIKELRNQASTAQRAVVAFKAKNNIVESGGRLLDEQQVAELNSQLMIAKGQSAEAKARLDRVDAVLRADSPDATLDSTVADTLKNEVITKLRTQYLELARRNADWTTRLGPHHLAVINVRNQMREIRNSILDELRRIAEGYKSDYKIAQQHERATENQLSLAVSQSQTTNQAQITLRELESNSQTYQALYDNFLQRYMEAVQQQSFPITEARVISPAAPPGGKSHPKTFFVLAFSGFAGIALGLGLGIFRELSDRVFRTSDHVESLLHADCLSLVPLVNGNQPSSRRDVPDGPNGISSKSKSARTTVALAKTESTTGPKKIVRNQSLLWTVVDEPLSRFTESIRAIKLAVDLNRVVKPNKVIGLTSSLPNEGKSTLAFALAQLMSQSGKSTILVDCDLRNPSLSRALTPELDIGILEVISGKVPLAEAVWNDPFTGMAFLPSVVRSRLAHSSEILGSEATRALFDQLSQDYEYVIADLSPLAPIVDVRATINFIDSYVMVIEWGRTKIGVVEHSLAKAHDLYENLLGIVLNKTNMTAVARYEGHREGYYFNKRYSRYGYTE